MSCRIRTEQLGKGRASGDIKLEAASPTYSTALMTVLRNKACASLPNRRPSCSPVLKSVRSLSHDHDDFLRQRSPVQVDEAGFG